MPNTFLHNDKLATLTEIRYLLFEVLEQNSPITQHDLAVICKEKSLNLAYAFENTLHFLLALSLIAVDKNKRISRRIEADPTLDNNEKLSSLLLQKFCAYLQTEVLLDNVLNTETVTLSGESLTVNPADTSKSCPLLKVLLLNFQIVEFHKDSNDLLFVLEPYKQFFTQFILNKQSVKAGTHQAKPKKTKFFISYASQDENYKNELKKHFKGLISKGLMEYWDGKIILPGEDWDSEIRKKLEQANVVLLLVSVDFMNSTYINDVELKRAIERYDKGLVKIIPIIVRPCDFESSDLKKYHTLPEGKRPIEKWENKEDAYVNIVEQIKNLLQTGFLTKQ